MEKFSIEKAIQAISERFTPEQREEQRRRSRQAIGRTDPSSPAAVRNRLRRLERSVLDDIDFLKSQPDSPLKTTRLNHALDRLGELLAEMGDYRQAIAVTQSAKRIEVYEQIQNAIDREGDEVCECPASQVRTARGVETLSPRHLVRKILTPDGAKNLIRCANCGAMNTK